jgi:hypothetical protein
LVGLSSLDSLNIHDFESLWGDRVPVCRVVFLAALATLVLYYTFD